MKHQLIYYSAFISVVLVLLFLAPQPLKTFLLPADQTILRVPQDFPTIQAAIDAAPDGATIQIAPGVYTENLKINKSVHLKGSGMKLSILEPAQGFRDHDNLNPLITIHASDRIQLRLSHLSLQQALVPPQHGDHDETVGLKIETGMDDAVSLVIENTKWTYLRDVIRALSRLSKLEIRDSQFKENSDSLGVAAETVELLRNLFLGNSLGPEVQQAKHLRLQENIIMGSQANLTTWLFLDLTKGGYGEISENVFALTRGVRICQSNTSATWIIRRNRFLSNLENLQICPAYTASTSLQFDVLIEENRIVGGNLGIDVYMPIHLQGASSWGEIRLHRNYITKQYAQHVGFPEDPGERNDIVGSHGVSISDYEYKGQVKIEMIENQIEFNEGWGIVINYSYSGSVLPRHPGDTPRCTFSEYKDQNTRNVVPLIVGRDNIFRSNGKGDLCPADYPWPPGFRK